MGRINSQARFERFNAYLAKTSQTARSTTWKEFDQFFLTTEKGAEETRFQQVISKLATGETAPLETKADKRSAKIAAVESAKPPRKARKAKTPAPEASWPLATEAEAIIADKASSPLLRALEPEHDDAATVASKAVALLAEIRDNGGIAPEATPEPIAAPVPDAVAAKWAKWAIAKRASRALAKARVQWRGDPELTAAAGAE